VRLLPQSARPAYGTAALSDVMPSVLAALGVPAVPNVLELPVVSTAVVLLVDGLGLELLRDHPDAAPFLSSVAARSLTAGFPTTTVASIASLGTGLPPGSHGLTGYTSYLEEIGSTFNWLGWHQVGAEVDLREILVPEQVQPLMTAFERALADGVAVTQVAPTRFLGSGLTRAVLRGGEYFGTVTAGDIAAQAAAAAGRPGRNLVYCYDGDLDLVGHVRGPGSESWRAQLALVDRFVEELATRLPRGAAMFVTADHGMVQVDEENKVDFDSHATLQKGVVALAGEARCRYVHVEPGAAADVLATWAAELGDTMWVISRDEAIESGLFGPSVSDAARRRIGDVLAFAHHGAAIVRRQREPRLSMLPGHHGSLTPGELLVPLLTYG